MKSSIIKIKPEKLIIGVCGVKKSGKDTAADMFIKEDDTFINLKISESLKNVCKQLFHFDESQVNSDKKDILDERYGTTPRKILQFFGTDIMQYEIQKVIKNCGKDFWIKDFLYKHRDEEKNIIISDLRFMHEYKILKEMYKDKFIVITIIRHTGSKDDHISEKEWLEIPCNYFISNNDSLDKLEENVKTIYNNIVNLLL